MNRCKWFDLPVSLFTFNCLKFDDENDIVPIFSEQQIPTPPETVEVIHLDDHLAYITYPAVRAKVTSLFDEIKNWRPGNISLDAIKGAVSMKFNGRVFAYLYPRRQHYLIGTYNAEDKWTEYPIKDDDDLTNVKPLMKTAIEKRMK